MMADISTDDAETVHHEPHVDENGLHWTYVWGVKTLAVHRTGWAGVWDALVAAITGNDQHTTAFPVTVDLWVATASPLCSAVLQPRDAADVIYLDGVRLSTGDLT